MTSADQREFKRLLTKLAAVFNRGLDADLLDSYFTALRHLSLETVRRVCTHATSEHVGYFPQPAELLNYVSAVHRTEPPRIQEQDGERVYGCHHCLDVGVVMTQTLDGMTGQPCTCPLGESFRTAWQSEHGHGRSMAEAGRDNARIVRQRENWRREREAADAAKP